jgi:hypothetical protein
MAKRGYHISEITKGTYGEANKIQEEFEEFSDAFIQNTSYGTYRGVKK